MPYYIEILTNKESIYPSIQSACESLNKVQDEFIYSIPNERLRESAYLYQKEKYDSVDVLRWLENYRTQAGGNRPYLIIVLDGILYSSKSGLTNLFGNAISSKGLAVFTVHSFDQFLHDKVRFCRYYMVRYTLSFLEPKAKSHKETRGCIFDKKIFKKDLLLSLETGNICQPCRDILAPKLNPEINDAIEKLLKIISNQYPYAIIMKGGGVKGLAFAGALLELEKHVSFSTFAGTSAGSIAAILLGSGYKPAELLGILRGKNFSEFKDSSLLKAIFFNLLFKKGLYPGDEIEKWIAKLVKDKNSDLVSTIKMSDLEKQTIVYASRFEDGTITFDSHGQRNETHAAFAARCSMSIPYYFFPKKIDDVRVYDGGLRNNFPIKIFMDNHKKKPFIGLYLKSHSKKSGFVLIDLMNITIEGEERSLVDKNLDKVVVIDTHPVKTTDFNLNDDKKDLLILAGRVAALNFLKKNFPDFPIDEQTINEYSQELQSLRQKLS